MVITWAEKVEKELTESTFANGNDLLLVCWVQEDILLGLDIGVRSAIELVKLGCIPRMASNGDIHVIYKLQE
jgi:hypothetical protein